MRIKGIGCLILCLSLFATSGCANNPSSTIVDNYAEVNNNDITETTCKHLFIPATCQHFVECVECGYTESVLGDHVDLDASCVEAIKCKECGQTIGETLRHSYSKGICTICGEDDPNYIRTYSLGEKWIVDGEWEFTINSVKTHYLCNDVSNELDGWTNEQVVFVDYTFTNLGFDGEYSGFSGEGKNTLSFWGPAHFEVYDEKNIKGSNSYGCIHANDDNSECRIGYTCQASEAFVLRNPSNTITIEVTHRPTSTKDEISDEICVNYIVNID